MTCDHKFIGSNHCLKCGWQLPGVALSAPNKLDEQAMLCPYNCGPHQIKEGLDGSWSCPSCCRSAPLWVVAVAAYKRGAGEREHLEEAARLLRALSDVVYTRHMGGESNVVAVAKWLEAERVRLGKKP